MESQIKKLHGLMQSRQISCQELTQNYIDAMERDNRKINAYVNPTAELAMETAKAVDKKIASGETLSPLAGIPMTLKDNLATKGIETTCCSNILKGYYPIYDATV